MFTELISKIDGFEAVCDDREYTDPCEVWELLGEIRNHLIGVKHNDLSMGEFVWRSLIIPHLARRTADAWKETSKFNFSSSPYAEIASNGWVGYRCQSTDDLIKKYKMMFNGTSLDPLCLMEHTYSFSVSLDTTIKVRATNSVEAEAELHACIGGSANLGSFEDGSPIVTSGVDLANSVLEAIDGEDV